MDIMKNGKNKILKRILIILIMFAIMIILSTVISSLTPKVNAYSYEVDNGSTTKYTFKTITNKTWTTNEKIARLYAYLYDITTSTGSLPTVEELKDNNLFIGEVLAQGATSLSSFHRAGTIFDGANEENSNGGDSAVNIICFEPSTWTFTSGDGSYYAIRQILYITPTSATFYKQTSGTSYNTYTTTNLSGFNFQRFLAQAYESQSDLNDAFNFAKYFTGNSTWKNTLNDRFGSSGIIESGFYSSNSTTSLNTTGNTSDYEYSGIFIWYSSVKTSSDSKIQGRIAYRVVREKKVPNVTITLKKQDFFGNSLSGATITVAGGDNVASIDTTSLTLGSGSVTVTPTSNTGTFTLKITEKEAPSGYTNFSGTITLTVKYNTSTGAVTSITSSNTTFIPNSSSSTATIKNKVKLNLTLNKTDSLTGDKLSGVKFTIKLDNISSITGYSFTGTSSNNSTTVTVTTDENGQINLTGIVPYNVYNDITLTITEVEVPDGSGWHYELIDPITVTLVNNNDGTYSIKTSDSETSSVSISGKNITVNISNQPLIDISGKVWLDGQIGEKNIAAPNGTKDDGEEGIAGVLVELRDSEGTTVVKSTETDENGEYSFKDIPRTSDGYRVYFSYDGINYIETKATGATEEESVAEEIDRSTFNARFETIRAGQSNDGTTLSYTYSSSDGTSTLNVDIDGTNPATNSADFRMQARTTTYTTTQENVDCGLVKKEFDLAIGTDVKEARLTINDKETTYTYAQIMDGALEDLTLDEILQGKSADKDVTYNLYLYSSDYNYRIAAYTNNSITNNVTEDNEFTETEDSELKAYVTYSIILKARTYTNSQVDEFVYYYDEKYTPLVEKGDVISGYEVTDIDTTNHKITFKATGNVKLESSDWRIEVDIEFEINDLTVGNTFANIAEITQYTTDDGGLIDRNSAPGNAEVTYANGTPSLVENEEQGYENDTDVAQGITISLKDEERTITGTVWDDGKFNDADGVYTSDGENKEDGVNDVIVQLIEIKTVTLGGVDYECEYIWQETRTGSGIVRKISVDGTEIEETSYESQGDGYYEFKGYIPGNYIIRFIYGDGTTYDLTDNVQTYNGQDYKSTIDPNYQEEWYDASNYTDTDSVARDNEARRLEVMAYSTIIDGDTGEALANQAEALDNEATEELVKQVEETLENTWMAAETSKINVQIDTDSTATSSSTVSYGDMNFGLAERPETVLVLEKHITALKITPNGTGVQSIIDARADITAIINQDSLNAADDVSGVITGLATTKSTRDNRGSWYVGTDLEELAQGAQLEVEYTYVVKNEGDEDYLSYDLISNYTSDVDAYSSYLEEKAAEVKSATKGNTQKYGTYLGQWYYTKVKADTDEAVLSRIEAGGIEEALNNDLSFATDGTSGNDFEVSETDVPRTTHDTEGDPVDTTISTVVTSTSETEFLESVIFNSEGKYTDGNTDYSKTITLRTVLASSSNGELGGTYPSYIAEITLYSNAAGRRNVAVPDNLSYVNSEDTNETMENSNEVDEFWGESIIISSPTGEDRISGLVIGIIVISSVAVIGVGIVLIKKFVIKR